MPEKNMQTEKVSDTKDIKQPNHVRGYPFGGILAPH